MPKVVPKNRFRVRKINYKSRIAVRIGSFDFGEDVVDYADVGDESHERSQPQKVETGVDKEEEHELHLQNAISASAAAVSGRQPLRSSGGPGSPTRTSAPIPHIPTPDATGLVENYKQLYPLQTYNEPQTYIRFSDTVEESVGVLYTMDEEDEDWLEQHNRQSLESNKSQESTTLGGNKAERHGQKRDKVAPGSSFPPLTEDEFEVIMDVFEQQTEEKCPLLHLDTSRIPSFDDFNESFVPNPEAPRLASLKDAAQMVYVHWHDRRMRRNGKQILPSLDHDETREDNPYVCFRRRDPKNVRKTRRTDAQNVDRIIRLSTDLAAAKDLLLKVLDRERIKREALSVERAIFEGRVQVRELKRKLGEKDGDESLLIGKREKRRKPNLEDMPVQQSLKIPLRMPRADNATAAPSTPIIAEPVQPFKDRTQAIFSKIEKDIDKKRAADRDFEDWTDGAYLPLHSATPARYWRTPDSISLLFPDGSTKGEACTFGLAYPHALGGLRPSFRRRVGRAGRLYLDRIIEPSTWDEDPFDNEEAKERHRSQWLFDSDSYDLPGSKATQIIDDFKTEYQSARIDLFRSDDLRALHSSPYFLEEAFNWLLKEPDKRPSTQIIGKLPIKVVPPPQMPSLPAPQQQQAPHQQPQPGIAGQMPPTPGQTAALMNSMHQAANHAHSVAAAAASQNHPKRTSSGSPLVPNIQAMPNLRRIPSGSLPGGIPLNGSLQQQQLAQWAQMNGMIGSGKMDPATFQNLAAQLQQQLNQQNATVANGLHLPGRGLPNGFNFPTHGSPLPVGANGFAATSRLAHSAPIGPNGLGAMADMSPTTANSMLNMSPGRADTPQHQNESNSPGLRSSRRSPQSLKNNLSQAPPIPYASPQAA